MRAHEIINRTTEESLGPYKEVRSVLGKGLGLMFRISRPKKSLIFIFRKECTAAIHMFFVFFPIDVLWLDKDKKVVEKKMMKPWSYYLPKNKSRYVIELSSGVASNVNVGDLIFWK